MGDHYVPRFYLKGFTEGDYLWVHDCLKGKSFKSTPKSVANENEMYGSELEQQLANQVEAPAIPAIEKIRAGEVLNTQDREALAKYVINLWKRVPKGRDRAVARLPEVAESVRKDLHAALDQLALTDPKEAMKVGAKKEAVNNVIDRYIEQRPPDIWQGSLAKGGTGLPEATLLGMNWHFLQSRSFEFLTCDNPVFFFEGEGMANPQAELTLPISSNVCLWAHKLGAKPPYFYEAKPAAIRAINRRAAYNASRFVFSSRQEPWILPFAQKGASHQLSRFAF